MSRLKIFLLIFIIAILGIVFFQNQEPIAIKLLCPDSTQSCLYQTPQLPLAVWIALFTLAGIVTNLLVQVLSRYSYSGTSKQKYAPDELYQDRNPWTEQDNKQNKDSTSEKKLKDSLSQEDLYRSTSYEVPQQPESVERSGSTYSYRYRETNKSPEDNKNNGTKKTSNEFYRDSDINSDQQDQDDEDWI